MRRAIIAAMATALMASASVSAQPPERVLVDAVVFVEPPDRPGLCLPLPAGHLAVTVNRTSDPLERRRTDFVLFGFQDDPEVNVAIPVSQQMVTATTRVNGSYHYCWSIVIDAPETEAMSHAERGAYAHTVRVRITHRPD